MNSTRQTEIKYRADIDGLRAIAILSVVAYHVGFPWIAGGFIGVDIFFVISGFLITGLLLKEIVTQGTISIADFYARRVRRLLPALTLVLTVTLLTGAIFLPDFGEKQGLARSAIAAVCFSANQYFLASTGGYFDGPSELLPLLHLWTLAVEEQFYVVWPLILLLVLKFSPPDRRILRIRAAVVVLLICSFGISSWLLQTRPAAAFFTLPSRAWELALGALLATVPIGKSRWGLAAGVVGVALIGFGFSFFNSQTPFPGLNALVPVAGAMLVIVAGISDPSNAISRTLSIQPLVTIGLLSYSWYLWHWPLLSIVRNRRVTDANLLLDSGIALLALACAALSVRFVENPIRHHKGERKERPARNRVLLAGAGTLAVLILFAGGLGAWARYKPPSPYVALQDREVPPLQHDCLGRARTPALMLSDPVCDQIPPGRTVGESPLVVLWGDSHADAWSPALRTLAAEEKVELKVWSLASCAPLADTATSLGNGGPVPGCRNNNNEIVDGLRQLRKANPQRKIGVVLASRWPGYLGTFPIPVRDRAPDFPRFYDEHKGDSAQNLETLRTSLRVTVEIIRSLDMRILILLDGPEFRIAPYLCLDLGHPENTCAEPLSDIEAYRGGAVGVIGQITRNSAGLRVLDAMPFFCHDGNCPAFLNGHPVVYDASHISVSASRAFVPVMREDFRWLFQKD